MKQKNLAKAIRLIISIVICELAGVIGSIFTMPAIGGWYAGLVKPTINPPNWLFGPVWTALFFLMGISLYLIWKRGLFKKENKKAVLIFFLQLALNIAWSVVFFGLKSPFYAFIVIILLWLSILAMIMSFYKISRLAGLIQIPYILWVSFAAALNFTFWQLNM